jgi:hypothetical protein
MKRYLCGIKTVKNLCVYWTKEKLCRRVSTDTNESEEEEFPLLTAVNNEKFLISKKALGLKKVLFFYLSKVLDRDRFQKQYRNKK